MKYIYRFFYYFFSALSLCINLFIFLIGYLQDLTIKIKDWFNYKENKQ